MTEIRLARPEDRKAICEVHCAAFPSEMEADLVETLEAAGNSVLSLVAERDDGVVGHLLLSRMTAEADGLPVRALGLAPVAVLPGFQRQGIGGALIREAIAQAREAGERMIFLVGEPAYYSRFGFSLESARPFALPYAGDYFMALDLGASPPPSAGRADYAPAFAALEEAE